MKIERKLESIGVTSNALPVPGRDGRTNDGIRIGTAAITTLNYSNRDIEDVARILFLVIIKKDIAKALEIKKALVRRANHIF